MHMHIIVIFIRFVYLRCKKAMHKRFKQYFLLVFFHPCDCRHWYLQVLLLMASALNISNPISAINGMSSSLSKELRARQQCIAEIAEMIHVCHMKQTISFFPLESFLLILIFLSPCCRAPVLCLSIQIWQISVGFNYPVPVCAIHYSVLTHHLRWQAFFMMMS